MWSNKLSHYNVVKKWNLMYTTIRIHLLSKCLTLPLTECITHGKYWMRTYVRRCFFNTICKIHITHSQCYPIIYDWCVHCALWIELRFNSPLSFNLWNLNLSFCFLSFFWCWKARAAAVIDSAFSVMLL